MDVRDEMEWNGWMDGWMAKENRRMREKSASRKEKKKREEFSLLF